MAKILYHAVPVDWRKEQKYQFLEKAESIAGVKWQKLTPDKKGSWLRNANDEEFGELLSIGSKAAKQSSQSLSVFGTYGRGICSNNDDFVYDFDEAALASRAKRMVEAYSDELNRWKKAKCPEDIEAFLRVDPMVLKWIRRTKKSLQRGLKIGFEKPKVRNALYRPFCHRHHYFEPVLNEDLYRFEDFIPSSAVEKENRIIVVSDLGMRSPFSVLLSDRICDLHLCASTDAFQCFPLYTYSEDGKERQDNVTLGALVRFQNFYGDDAITRADVFYYVYAVLHHPAYRTRYAENLKRELPRIPLIAADGTLHAPPHPSVGDDVRSLHSSPPPVGDEVTSLHSASAKKGKKSEPPHVVSYESDAAVFHAFAAAGRKLADLHVHYETAPEFPLQRIENKEVPLDWRVEVMKLVGRRRGDESHLSPKKSESLLTSAPTLSLVYNDFLTLTGIPAEALDYRLGNRSALEWVIDQYRVSRDEHGKVTSDPNRLDDEQYIVRLVGQVITVSLETQKIVQGLPQLRFEDEPAGK